MQKRIISIVIAVVLVLSVSSVALAAPPTGSVEITGVTPALPADTTLYKTQSYDAQSAEWQNFISIKPLADNQEFFALVDIALYNNTTGDPAGNVFPGNNWTLDLNAVIPQYTATLDDQYMVYKLSGNAGETWTGPISNDPSAVATGESFGRYAVVHSTQLPIGLNELQYMSATKIDYVHLMKKTEYEEWQLFQIKEIMNEKKIDGTLNKAYPIQPWATLDTSFWVQDMAFLNDTFGMTGPFTITSEFPGQTVLFSADGGQTFENLGSGSTFEVDTLFGILAYVDTSAQPTTEPTTQPTTEPTTQPTTEPTVEPTVAPTVEADVSPKTDDTTPSTLIFWCVLAIAVSISMIFVLRKKCNTEK